MPSSRCDESALFKRPKLQFGHEAAVEDAGPHLTAAPEDFFARRSSADDHHRNDLEGLSRTLRALGGQPESSTLVYQAINSSGWVGIGVGPPLEQPRVVGGLQGSPDNAFRSGSARLDLDGEQAPGLVECRRIALLTQP